MDFSQGVKAAKTINDFVNKSTNGEIKELVGPDSFDSNTKLMLINAVYFNGKWKTEFKKAENVPGTFTVEQNKVSEDVEYMTLTQYFRQVNNLTGGIRVLEMPYKDEEFAMYFILPPKDMDIRDFDWEQLDLQKLDDKLKMDDAYVKLPKFDIEYEKSLQQLFKDLGAADAFGPTGKDYNTKVLVILF